MAYPPAPRCALDFSAVRRERVFLRRRVSRDLECGGSRSREIDGFNSFFPTEKKHATTCVELLLDGDLDILRYGRTSSMRHCDTF